MKKLMKSIQIMAALLVAVAASTACTSDDSIADEPTTTTDEPKTYTMTVEASKGDASRDQSRACSSYGEAHPALDEVKGDATRALTLDGKTLNATWTAGDVVTVYNETKSALLGGTLVAQSSGASTTLTGTLTGDIGDGDELTLKFLSPDYNGQDGTLEYIAAHCDYAKATVTVASTVGGNITTTGVANFENMGVIIRFTLKGSDGTPLNVDNLTLKTGNMASYTITPETARSEYFVAVQEITDMPVVLNTIVGEDIYTYRKESVTFAKGQYYSIGVKMAKFSGDLAALLFNYTAKDGDVLSGTLDKNLKLSIADGATVTLAGVNIEAKKAAGITCSGSAAIEITGTNIVKTTKGTYPGIQAGPSDKTLTISGSGSLTATGDFAGAGIGSGPDNDCGDIIIQGGTILAQGGRYGAGIGTGGFNLDYYLCGNIRITGGTITAKGGTGAAGIGTGHDGYGYIWSNKCESITIKGCTVEATGGANGAGIGTGEEGRCGDITIYGSATVTATRGKDGQNPIGAGKDGKCHTITIGGETNWTAGVATGIMNFTVSNDENTWTLTPKH